MENGKWLFIIACKIDKMIIYFINQDYQFLGRKNLIEIVSDEEQNIQEAYSPAVIESCTFSSDSEQEKTLSTYSRQKKVSRVLWMDEPVKDVPSIPYDCVQSKSKEQT